MTTFQASDVREDVVNDVCLPTACLSNRLSDVQERRRNAIGRMNRGDGNRIRQKGWTKIKVRTEDRGERIRYEINYEI